MLPIISSATIVVVEYPIVCRMAMTNAIVWPVETKSADSRRPISNSYPRQYASTSNNSFFRVKQTCVQKRCAVFPPTSALRSGGTDTVIAARILYAPSPGVREGEMDMLPAESEVLIQVCHSTKPLHPLHRQDPSTLVF